MAMDGFHNRSRATILMQTPLRGLIRKPTEKSLLNATIARRRWRGEAEVKFLGGFRIVRPGAFVRCAVTGVPIPARGIEILEVELQEPYASPEAVMRRCTRSRSSKHPILERGIPATRSVTGKRRGDGRERREIVLTVSAHLSLFGR